MSALLYKFPFEPCVKSSNILWDVFEIVIIVIQNCVLFVLVGHCFKVIIMAVNLAQI